MSRQVLTYPDMPPVLTQSAGDLRYLQQGQADARYLQLTGGTLSGQLTISAGTPYALDLSGDIMLRGMGINFANPAFTSSAGWKYVDGQGLAHVMNGSPTGTFFDTNGAPYIKGAVSIAPGAENLAGEWLLDNVGVRRSYVGLEGDYSSWRIYAPAVGNAFSIRFSDGYTSVSRDLGVSGGINVTGTITGVGSVLSLATGANIQLAPGGTYIHPHANNVVNLGHPGLNWVYVWTYNVNSPGGSQLGINGGFHLILTASNGGWIYHRSTGHTFFDGSSGTIVAPEIDNKLICGGTGNRWQYVAAVNGGINTCFEHEKAIVGEIQPDDALDAINKTPFFLYHPKDFEGNVDESLTFAGPVNTSVDARLQIGEGALTAAGHQAAYACAAIKALTARIEALEAARV